MLDVQSTNNELEQQVTSLKSFVCYFLKIYYTSPLIT